MRRSPRLSTGKVATDGRTREPKNKRPRRTTATRQEAITRAVAAPAAGGASGRMKGSSSSSSNDRLTEAKLEKEGSEGGDESQEDEQDEGGEDGGEEQEEVQEDQGPSAYELQRLAKIKQNAMMLASLGLSGVKGEMRTAVNSDAAQRAKSRGLGARKKRAHPVRTRESARVRGRTPEGLPMEDPEEALIRKSRGVQARPSAEAGAASQRTSRISGDVSMEASNASEDGTLRLRKMMGGLVGRYDTADDEEDYELAEPDETLKRLRDLKLGEAGVCKVVRERAYSASWHPSNDKLLLAVGDKVGHVGVWTVDESVDDESAEHGVFQFKPHTGAVPRLTFDTVDSNKLISTSYDGTVRRMDVEKGAFEEMFGSTAEEDEFFFTDGHLLVEERLMMLSDSVGDITAVDLRTNKQVWKREAHEKKVNTVHTHPTSAHVFVTASLDRSVRLWDARNLGAGTGAQGIGGMKHVAELPHLRSVNSAHFSPTGEWVATVCQDDKIRLYENLANASGPQVKACQVLPHNNQTGRWLTKFQASWDPKSKGLFSIGSMQKYPHGVHLYSVNGGTQKPSAVEVTGGDIMTSIQSVVAFHPSRDVLAGVNASGRAHIFM